MTNKLYGHVLTQSEFDAIKKEVDIFVLFMKVWKKHADLHSYYTPTFSLSDYYGKDGIYVKNLRPTCDDKVDNFIDTLRSWTPRQIIGNFGCIMISETYVFFPMPLMICGDIDAVTFVWQVYYEVSNKEYEFLTILSEMYKMKVSKKDLPNKMLEYFDYETVNGYFSNVFIGNYAYILRNILKEGYAVEVKKKALQSGFLIRTIYDLWDKLLTSKGVLNLEPVKKMWGMTAEWNNIKNWEAIRECKYITMYSISAIVTYANLYEKGIESDFGKAILKNLKDKKESRILSPLERYIADVRGLPYKVSETASKEVFDTAIIYYDYTKIYKSALDNIFVKLKEVGRMV